MENDLPEIAEEFFSENKNHSQKTNLQRKKSGPHSKKQRNKRKDEVYRLHFEYGYSARKIADLMKINRNTVNGDINYWYSKIVKNTNVFNPEFAILINLERLEIQHSRLREQLDKTKSVQEKLAFERLIFDIDSKILHTYHKLTDSSVRVMNYSTNILNTWMKQNKSEKRYMTMHDKFSVSEKAKARINKIINEDRLRGRNL